MSGLLDRLCRDPRDDATLTLLLRRARETPAGLVGLQQEVAVRANSVPSDNCWAIVIGHVARARGDLAGAEAAYRKAHARGGAGPAPSLALAELRRDRGDLHGVRKWLEAAMADSSPSERANLSLEHLKLLVALGDLDVADERAAELRHSARSCAAVTQTLGAALTEAGHPLRASRAFAAGLATCRLEPTRRAELQLQWAQAQLAAGLAKDAAQTVQPLWRVPALDSTAYDLSLRAHRQAGTLSELEAALRTRRGSPAAQLVLARLLRDRGDVAGGTAALRRLLRQAPAHVEARRLLIDWLLARGEVQDVLRELRALPRRRGANSALVAAAADRFHALGERGAALEALRILERHAAVTTDGWREIYERYVHWGEAERALKLARRWSTRRPRSEHAWSALGEQLVRQGRKAEGHRALQRVQRLSKSDGHRRLGALLLDQGMVVEAVAAYRQAEAAHPNNLQVLRELGQALERAHQGRAAIEVWQRVLRLAHPGRTAPRAGRLSQGASTGAPAGPAVSAEARRHLVDLWASRGELERELGQLRNRLARLARRPGQSAEAQGVRLLLAAGYARQARRQRHPARRDHYWDLADGMLRAVADGRPGDPEALHALERLRTLRGDAAGALEVLKRLVGLDGGAGQGQPRLRVRLAESAIAGYRDAEARTQLEALALGYPSDAQIQEQVGRLYQELHDLPRAVAAYRRAVELDPTADDARLALAQLSLAGGQPVPDAAPLLLDVVRTSPDPQRMTLAAHTALALDPQDLAIPLDGALRRRADDPGSRRQALHAWVGLFGRRALAPSCQTCQAAAVSVLLSALGTGDASLQQRSVAVLARVEGAHARVATAGLLAFAEAPGPVPARRTALVAVARHSHPDFVPRLAALALSGEPRLQAIAAWGAMRAATVAHLPELQEVARRGRPAAAGYALLALAELDPQEAAPRAVAGLASTSPWLRGAAALALAVSRPEGFEARLADALRRARGPGAAAVLAALARLPLEARLTTLLPALSSLDRRVHALVGPALERPSTHSLRAQVPMPRSGRPSAARLGMVVLQAGGEVPDAVPDVARDEMPADPGGGLSATLEHGLRGPSWAVDAILGRLEIARLSTSAGLPRLLRLLSEHSDPAVRARVPALLSGLAPGAAPAVAALDRSLRDPSPVVREAALAATAAHRHLAAYAPWLCHIAEQDPYWVLRRRALRAWAREIRGDRGGEERVSAPRCASDSARRALLNDSHALVRLAALAALRALRPAQLQEQVSLVARRDPDPEVRAAAARAVSPP